MPSTTISESLFDSSLNAHDKTRAGKKLTRTKREFVSRKALAKQKKKKVNSRQHKNLICLQIFTRAHRISHTHGVHTLKFTVVDTCITSGLHRERSNEYFNPIPPGEGGGGGGKCPRRFQLSRTSLIFKQYLPNMATFTKIY